MGSRRLFHAVSFGIRGPGGEALLGIYAVPHGASIGLCTRVPRAVTAQASSRSSPCASTAQKSRVNPARCAIEVCAWVRRQGVAERFDPGAEMGIEEALLCVQVADRRRRRRRSDSASPRRGWRGDPSVSLTSSRPFQPERPQVAAQRHQRLGVEAAAGDGRRSRRETPQACRRRRNSAAYSSATAAASQAARRGDHARSRRASRKRARDRRLGHGDLAAANASSSPGARVEEVGEQARRPRRGRSSSCSSGVAETHRGERIAAHSSVDPRTSSGIG